MKATLSSTTGTAPIRITRRDSDTVRIELEDGSMQVYNLAELVAVVAEVQK
jgi:hypothetical protein